MEWDLNRLIKISKGKHLYLLDASATFHDTELENYPLKTPAILILTTTFLREFDDNKHSNRLKYNLLTKKLRSLSNKKKLSKGVALTAGKIDIVFIPYDLIKLPPSDYISWLSPAYGDAQIVACAIFLKNKLGKNITIISADNLIKILAKEFDIDHLFIEFKTEIPPGEEKTESKSSKLIGEIRATSNKNAEVSTKWPKIKKASESKKKS